MLKNPNEEYRTQLTDRITELKSEQSKTITEPPTQDFMTPPEGSAIPVRDLSVDDGLKADIEAITGRNEFSKKDVKSAKAGNLVDTAPSLTFGGVLDAIKIGLTDLSSIVRGVRGNNIAYADKITNSFIKSNPIDITEKKIAVEDADIIGSKFPNDSQDPTVEAIVTPENVGTLKEKFKQTFEDLGLGLTKKETDALSNIAFNEEMYILMRDDKAKLDKYFTPEYQARMEAKLASEKTVNDTVGQILVDRGLLSEKQFLEKDYVRYFLSDLYMNSIGKGKYVIDLFGDGARSYNSPLDALRALDAVRSLQKSGKGTEFKINEESVQQLNSIFKDKSKNLDLFRFHSPTLRTLNYSKYAGQALRDADLLKMFQELSTSKDKKVQAELASMLGSKYRDNVVTAFLGLGEPTGVLANTANAMSKSIMFGRLGTLAQAFTSTGLRSSLLTGAKLLGNQVGISPADIAMIANPIGKGNNKDYIELKRIMEANGIIGEFELFDKGNVGRVINKGVEISSGAPIEQAFKTIAGLAEMQAILKQNGITPPSNKALDIARTYDAWSKIPANRNAFFRARNSMEDNMRWLGDVSKMSKTPLKWLSTAGFQALKPYLYGKVNNIIRDYNKIYKAVLTKEGVPADAVAPAARQLGDAVIYYVIAQVAANAAQAVYGTDDEVSEKVGQTFSAKMFGGNPANTLRDLISSGLSNPALQGLNIAVKSATALIAGLTGQKEGAGEDAAIQAVKAILSSMGITQPADLALLGLTDKTSLANVADLIGAINPEGQSAFGYASGSNPKSFADKLSQVMNFSPDRAITDILYKKLGELDYQNRFGETAGSVAFEASKLLSDTVMPITQIQNEIKSALPFGEAVENRLDQYNVRDVMKPLSSDEPITLVEFIAQSGIDSDTAEIIGQEIPKMWLTEAKGNADFAKTFGFD